MNTQADSVATIESDDAHADVREAIAQLQNGAEEQPEAGEGAARNERGQFSKADGAGEPQTEAGLEVSDADPAPAPVTQPSTAGDAPTSWSPEAKSTWSSIPLASQQAILKREQEINDGGARWSTEKKTYEETLAPLRPASQQYGISEREIIERYIAAENLLKEDPIAGLQWLAQSYGVDLSTMTQTQRVQAQTDPAVSQLFNKFKVLEETIQQSEERRQMEAFESQFSEFAKTHPHFSKVRVTMGKLMQSGEVDSLEAAYDAAVWMNKDTRAELMAAQTPSPAVQKQAQQVAQARRGAISVKGSPGVVGTPAGTKKDYESVEDAARAAFELHRR